MRGPRCQVTGSGFHGWGRAGRPRSQGALPFMSCLWSGASSWVSGAWQGRESVRGYASGKGPGPRALPISWVLEGGAAFQGATLGGPGQAPWAGETLKAGLGPPPKEPGSPQDPGWEKVWKEADKRHSGGCMSYLVKEGPREGQSAVCGQSRTGHLAGVRDSKAQAELSPGAGGSSRSVSHFKAEAGRVGPWAAGRAWATQDTCLEGLESAMWGWGAPHMHPRAGTASRASPARSAFLGDEKEGRGVLLSRGSSG